MTTPFPPYVIYDEQTGIARGPAVDVISRVCMESQIRCKIRVEPWARAYETALQNPDTLIFSIARRPDREALFKWIGTVAPYHVRLFSLNDYAVPVVDDWHALVGFQVAGQMRDVKAQYLEDAGFEVMMAPSAEATIRMLFAGRAMLVAGDALSLPYRVAELEEDSTRLHVVASIPELSSELYLAASLATNDVVIDAMRAALEAIKQEGAYDRIWASSGILPSN
ncbi:MAG: substrate-binding periplasmic protein [Thalassospira sp.]|uniref:substrate-binding periplasmic protein n=1 Tax=Thalassospira sp. TaxID=1912094 RepID=UPI003A85B775